MTVFELGILLHYYARVDDCDACNRNVPIWRETVEMFLREELLRRAPEPIRDACYEITDRGRAFVDALQTVPLPTQHWRVEWPASAQAK